MTESTTTSALLERFFAIPVYFDTDDEYDSEVEKEVVVVNGDKKKYFADASASSEEEDESDAETEGEGEEEEEEQPQQPEAPVRRSRFAKGSDSEDTTSSDEGEDGSGRSRVMSQKEKAEARVETGLLNLEFLLTESCPTLLKDPQGASFDWTAQLEGFEGLLKATQLASKLAAFTPEDSARLGKAIAGLEVALAEVHGNAAVRKAMLGREAKSFAALRLRLRKAAPQFAVPLVEEEKEPINKETGEINKEIGEARGERKPASSSFMEDETPVKAESSTTTTKENAQKKYQELMAARVKRNADKPAIIAGLRRVLAVLDTPHQADSALNVLSVIVSMELELLHSASSGSSTCVPDWMRITRDVEEFARIVASGAVAPADAATQRATLGSFLHRCNEEIAARLLPASTETTVGHIGDRIVALAVAIWERFRSAPETAALAQHAALVALEHLHARSSAEDSSRADALARFLYGSAVERTRIRALLLHSFNLATLGRWRTARDLLIASRIHELSGISEPAMGIAYNRAVARIAVAAFQEGAFVDAYHALSGLCNSGRIRELLGQSTSAATTTTAAAPAASAVPAHLHLPIDSLDVVFLTCSLLIEIPALAAARSKNLLSSSAGQSANQPAVQSRYLRRLVEAYERNALSGAHPESPREHLICAAKALATGLAGATPATLITEAVSSVFPTIHADELIMRAVLDATLVVFAYTHASAFSRMSLPTVVAEFVPGMSLDRATSILSVLIGGTTAAATCDSYLFQDCTFTFPAIAAEFSAADSTVLECRPSVEPNALQERAAFALAKLRSIPAVELLP